jgi:hypothetical protein
MARDLWIRRLASSHPFPGAAPEATGHLFCASSGPRPTSPEGYLASISRSISLASALTSFFISFFARLVASSYCALAHPAVAFSSAGYRQEGEGSLTEAMRTRLPARIGGAQRLMRRREEVTSCPSPLYLEGSQALSSSSEYLASP